VVALRVGVSIPDFSNAIKKAGASQIKRRAESAGRLLEADLQKRVALIPIVNAGAKKHGTKGSVHNVTFTHRVVGSGESFPIHLTADAHGSKGDLMKMWLLNNGRGGGVRIVPKKENGWLKFQWGSDEGHTYARAVTQGAMKPLKFIEEALARLPWKVQARYTRRR
jgi:hypothetical protein